MINVVCISVFIFWGSYAGDGIDYSDWFLSDDVYDSIGEAAQVAKQLLRRLISIWSKGQIKPTIRKKSVGFVWGFHSAETYYEVKEV